MWEGVDFSGYDTASIGAASPNAAPSTGPASDAGIGGGAVSSITMDPEAEASFIAAQTHADRSGNAGKSGSLAGQALAFADGLFTGNDGSKAPGVLPGALAFNAVVAGMAAVFGRDSIGEFGAFPGDAGFSVSNDEARALAPASATTKAGTEAMKPPAGSGTSSLAGTLDAAAETARAEVVAEARRRFGRRATMITGVLGDPSPAPVSRPSLLGIAG